MNNFFSAPPRHSGWRGQGELELQVPLGQENLCSKRRSNCGLDHAQAGHR